MGDLPGCIVTRYQIAEDKRGEDRIEARSIEGGVVTSWAAFRRGFILSTSGEYGFEPQPSSRDGEFLAQFRFATAEEALAALTASREREET